VAFSNEIKKNGNIVEISN